MRRKLLLITFFVILHLLIIDITFWTISSGASVSMMAISLYNVIWLLITITIATQIYRERRGN